MKIGSATFNKFLQNINNEPNNYLIFGPEFGLVDNFYRKIINKLFNNKIDKNSLMEFSYEKIKDNSLILHNELNQLSFFPQNKVIVIKDINVVNKEILNMLEKTYFKTFIILIANDLSNKNSVRKFYEDHKSFYAIACYSEDEKNIISYVENYIKNNNININSEAKQIFIDSVQGNRLNLDSELEKLFLFAQDQEFIDINEVNSLISSNLESKIETFINAYFTQNNEQIISYYSYVISEISEVGLLRYLNNHANKLQKLREIIDNGKSIEAAIAEAKPPIFFKQKPAIYAQLNKLNSVQLNKIINNIFWLESYFKTSNMNSTIFQSRLINY